MPLIFSEPRDSSPTLSGWVLANRDRASVCLQPRLVSWSVSKGSSTWPELRQTEHIGVSVLLQLHDVLVHRRGQPLICRRSEFRRLAPSAAQEY